MSDLMNKGRHLAQCRSIGFDRTGKDDKETVVVAFELVDEHDANVGWRITAWLYLTDATFDRTIESLRHLGWQGDDLAELPDLAAAGQLAETVELVVDHEEWEGVWRAKVKWINKVGGGTVQLKKPLEGSELASFAARMKGRVRAAGGGRPSNAKRPMAPHPNAPGADDDIPFATSEMSYEPSPIAAVIRGGV